MLHGQPFVKEIGATTCNMRGKFLNKINGWQQPDELRRINADGSNDRLLLKQDAAAVPSIGSAILKASNSAPTADGSISSRRLGQHQTHCTRSTCAPAKKIFCCAHGAWCENKP